MADPGQGEVSLRTLGGTLSGGASILVTVTGGAVDYGDVRRHALRLCLVFLALTGLVAITCILFWDFDTLQLKILGTCLSLSAASICAMGCAAYIDRHRRRGWAVAGIQTAIASAVLISYGIWAEVDDEWFWKSTLSLIVVTVSIFHALVISIPTLDEEHRWVQRVGVGAMGTLAVMVLAVIWGEFEVGAYYQLLAAVVTVAGLVIVSIPILVRMRRGPTTRLVLEHVDGDEYRGEDGQLYRVMPAPDPAESMAPESVEVPVTS